jgi:hypothetical protein
MGFLRQLILRCAFFKDDMITKKHRTFLLFALLLISYLCVFMSQANEAETPDWRQTQVKIIYNLSKFVTWPESIFTDAENPFNFCLLGTDRFQIALEALINRSLRGRPIRFHAYSESQETQLQNCQVLFISQTLAEQLPTILAKLQNRPILTVSDMANFAEQGGIIGLIPTEGRVHFEINLDVARKQQLAIRAPLLQMASIVQRAANE